MGQKKLNTPKQQAFKACLKWKCTSCGAPRGKPCVSVNGKPTAKPHQPRWKKYQDSLKK